MLERISKKDIRLYLGLSASLGEWPSRSSRPWNAPLKDPAGLNASALDKSPQIILAEYNEEITNGFKELLSYFIDHDSILFYDWIRAMEPSLDKEGYLYGSTVEYDARTLNSISFPDNSRIKILKVNIEGLTPEQIRLFLEAIKPHALFALELTGEPSPDLLKAITNVQFIRVNTKNSELQKLASQINHRNHLAKKLSVDAQNSETLLKRLAQITPYKYDRSGDKLFYLKAHNNEGQETYIDYIKNLYSEVKNQAKNHYQFLSTRNFEYYHVINACMEQMGDLFFEAWIKEMASSPEFYTQHYKELVINDVLNQFRVEQLIKQPLPFKKLTLFVDAQIVADPKFKELLEAFNAQGVEQLTLTVRDTSIAWDPELFTSINFLIRFHTAGLSAHFLPFEGGKQATYTEQEKALQQAEQAIEQEVMRRVQARNYEHLLTRTPLSTIKRNTPPLFKRPSEAEFAPKIAIKEYIWNQDKQFEANKDPLNLEVRHVEVEQQVVVQNTLITEVAQRIHIEEQQFEQVLPWDEQGDLVSYAEFTGQPYYGLIQAATHLEDSSKLLGIMSADQFANLPMAIKFMTHEAATEVARSIQAYAVFNVSSLPEHFCLKKTSKGELVLDYNPYMLGDSKTLFTPCSVRYSEDRLPFLNYIKLQEEQIASWIGDEALWTAFKNSVRIKHREERDYSCLTQMYSKYGELGCRHFFQQIKELTSKHQDFSAFLIKHYLAHFAHLDVLLDNNDLFDALRAIDEFDEKQLTCFKKFLENTGTSRHDLKKSVKAFQFFWSEWLKLCEKNHIDPDRINVNWFTLEAGNPVVYMERLLTILTNARSLQDQLDDLEGLELNNYGAYYASKYQDFRHVSKEMHLLYHTGNTGRTNNEPLPTKPLYKVDLNELLLLNASADTSYAPFWRYLGTCSEGITVNSFRWAVRDLERRHPDLDLSPVLMSVVLATEHARYQRGDPVHQLISTALNIHTKTPQLLKYLNKELLELRGAGVLLTAYEVGIIYQMVQVEAAKRSDEELEELFYRLKTNPYNALRCLEHLMHYKVMHSLAPAFQRAKALDKHQEIHQFYQDDLLLFSSLLSLEALEEKTSCAIDEFIAEAASLKKPNNLDYLFKELLQAVPPINPSKVLKLVAEVKSIASVDFKQVDQLITEAGFNRALVPSQLIRVENNDAIKRCTQELYRAISPQCLDIDTEQVDIELIQDHWKEISKSLSTEVKQSLLFPIKKAYLNLAFEQSRLHSWNNNDFLETELFTSCVELEDLPKLLERATELATKLYLIRQKDGALPVLNWGAYTQEELNTLLSLMVSLLNRPHKKLFEQLVLLKALPELPGYESFFVLPAKAGIHTKPSTVLTLSMDPRLRGDDSHGNSRRALLKGAVGTDYLDALKVIAQLQAAKVPDAWLSTAIQWIHNRQIEPKELSAQLTILLANFEEQRPNPLLQYLMTFETPALITSDALFQHVDPQNQEVVAEFLQFLMQNNQMQAVFNSLQPMDQEQALVLQIMARAHSRARVELSKKISTDYCQLGLLIKEKFNLQEKGNLLAQFTIVPPYPNCLLKAVEGQLFPLLVPASL